MIPLKINNTHLCKIFEPDLNVTGWTEDRIMAYSIEKKMMPTEVRLSSETYSRDADRNADYELQDLQVVNAKCKPEFTWSMLKAEYVEKLLVFVGFKYDFRNAEGEIVPEEAATLTITFRDFIGTRTIYSYLGQSIDGTLVEHNGQLYWENFRLGFPER